VKANCWLRVEFYRFTDYQGTRISVGPYVAVQVYGKVMRATAIDLTLPVVANVVPTGWEVCGLEGQVFDTFTVFRVPKRKKS
jgi:hypothetical protein